MIYAVKVVVIRTVKCAMLRAAPGPGCTVRRAHRREDPLKRLLDASPGLDMARVGGEPGRVTRPLGCADFARGHDGEPFDRYRYAARKY